MNPYVMALMFMYLWDVLVMGTCAYAVFWLDCSGWWFVLAAALCLTDHDDIVRRIKETQNRQNQQ